MLVVRNKKSPNTFYDGRLNNQFGFHPLLMNDLHRFFGSDEHSEVPKVNISEDEKNFTIELAAPGVNKEDLKINIEKDVLTIGSEVKKEESANSPAEGNKLKFIRKEFSYYGFKRSFKLSENVDSAGIKASYTNGILAVVLPKKDTTTENDSKTITIS